MAFCQPLESILGESTRTDSMTTRRRPATKSAKTATPVTKSTPSKSTVKVKEVVTKYTQPQKIFAMTETPTPEASSSTKTRRFATTRPSEPKISLEEYVTDFKIRMQINNYEVMEFWEDCVRFYHSSQPVVIKFIDYVKDSYDRAFNQEEEKKEEKE